MLGNLIFIDAHGPGLVGSERAALEDECHEVVPRVVRILPIHCLALPSAGTLAARRSDRPWLLFDGVAQGRQTAEQGLELGVELGS
ncbi:hypothetical protein GCM10023222_39600 [Saccharopolyspora cebuensis]